MSISKGEFFLGVLVAVASFLIKELIAHLAQGFRYRRRLAVEINMIVNAFNQHYPELVKLKNSLSAEEASYIWDREGDSLEELQRNTQHLKADEVIQCSSFYNHLARIDEIRREYNLSVRGIITSSENRNEYAAISTACLEDLQSHYIQVIKCGCEFLMDLTSNHHFLAIDRGQCEEILSRYA